MSSQQIPGYKRHSLDEFTPEIKRQRTNQKLPNGDVKKTRGRVKINIEFIQDKQKRCTTFSKRKAGLMKKSHELATLTGSQVMVLVASETGHVYTYSTEKFKPLLNSQQGRKLIRTCLSDKSRSGQDEEDINIDEVKVDQLDSDENMDFEHEQGDVDVSDYQNDDSHMKLEDQPQIVELQERQVDNRRIMMSHPQNGTDQSYAQHRQQTNQIQSHNNQSQMDQSDPGRHVEAQSVRMSNQMSNQNVQSETRNMVQSDGNRTDLNLGHSTTRHIIRVANSSRQNFQNIDFNSVSSIPVVIRSANRPEQVGTVQSNLRMEQSNQSMGTNHIQGRPSDLRSTVRVKQTSGGQTSGQIRSERLSQSEDRNWIQTEDGSEYEVRPMRECQAYIPTNQNQYSVQTNQNMEPTHGSRPVPRQTLYTRQKDDRQILQRR